MEMVVCGSTKKFSLIMNSYVGFNPGCDHGTQGYKWVPVRVEV